MRHRMIVWTAIAAGVAAAAFLVSGSSEVAPSVEATPPPAPLTVARPSRPPVLPASHEDAQQNRATFYALVDQLRRDPSVAGALERELAALPADAPRARLVVGAMVAVGTPALQAALVRVLQTRASDPAFVQLVLPSLGFVHRPTSETEAAVRGYARAGAETRGMAELALGTIASHVAASDPARADAIVDGFTAQLAGAGTVEDRIHALHVLGNAGTPGAAAAIATQLASGDAALRGQAVKALRHVATPEAEQQLAIALDDGDARVRATAARALAYRAPSPATLQAMLARLGGESDDTTALALLDTLWSRRAADPAAVDAATRAMAQHGSQEVRQRAASLLTAAR